MNRNTIRTLCFSLLLAGGCLAEKPAAKPQSARAAAHPSGLPAGAVEVKPGLFRHTDQSGKVWMYQRTPFGYSRFLENQSLAAETPSTAGLGIKVLGEDDQVVRFERKTAFGMRRWESSKTDLTPDEKAAWLRSRNSDTATPPQPAASSAAKTVPDKTVKE